jgi:hypothetical protein
VGVDAVRVWGWGVRIPTGHTSTDSTQRGARATWNTGTLSFLSLSLRAHLGGVAVDAGVYGVDRRVQRGELAVGA